MFIMMIYGQELSQNDDYIFDEPSISDDIEKVSHDDLINRNGVLQTSGWYI